MSVITSEWTAQDIQPMEDGTFGGDGASWAYSARWVKKNEDGTYSVISTYWYPVDLRERLPQSSLDWYDETWGSDTLLWDVENMTEYIVCTDPEDVGGTEIWSDAEYDDEILDVPKFTENRARTVCYDKCMDEIRNFDHYYNWGGQPR